YAYDKASLDARVESKEETDDWTAERISFAAAYGGERVIAYLYLPTSARPPFQTVVYFGGDAAIVMDKYFRPPAVEFITRSGRAVLTPVFKGTLERHDGLTMADWGPTLRWRDHAVAWVKDIGRSIDYLETRPEIDRDRIAFYGFSRGSAEAPIVLAIEDRFRTAVLVAGGMDPKVRLPEVAPTNFIGRVHIPVLILHGRYDAVFPFEASLQPFFDLLGTPTEQKRFIIYDSGHIPPPKDVIRESLAWLDRYLGPGDK